MKNYISASRSGNNKDIKDRFPLVAFIVLITFFIILARLWQLQIIMGDQLRNQSENNRIRLVKLPAPRGLILDRKGKVLVNNRPSFNVQVIPYEIDSIGEFLPKLCKYIELSDNEYASLKKKIESHTFKHIMIKRDIRWKELVNIEENKTKLPGVIVEVEPKRHYPYGDLAAHLLGHVGEIDARLLSKSEYRSYNPGDIVGKSGIEKTMEKYLRGSDGGRQVEVTAAGREVKILNNLEASPGKNVYLTIDLDLQMAAERAFKGMSGAAVVMEVNTGKVLAMFSRPSFNPSIFTEKMTMKKWRSLVNDPLKPLENRATRGLYPPGSTFKIITAIATLWEGVIKPEDELFCPGYYHFGDRTYRCWKSGGHGYVNLHNAIVQSCDVYFYQLGTRLEIRKLAKYAKMFGFGSKTGIHLEGEATGLIPDPEWKLRFIGERWNPGETILTTIGQGYVLVTPLQMACAISAIANGGTLYEPLVVEKVVDKEGQIIYSSHTRVKRKINIPHRVLDPIRKALWGVVNEPLGTGIRARLPSIDVAGKTGTAQTVAIRKGEEEKSDFNLRDHAWFVCYAPFRNPEVAVVVIVEHGGKGGKVAAPIARQILEEYFRITRQYENKQKIIAKY